MDTWNSSIKQKMQPRFMIYYLLDEANTVLNLQVILKCSYGQFLIISLQSKGGPWNPSDELNLTAGDYLTLLFELDYLQRRSNI